jgi:hypothetical protein
MAAASPARAAAASPARVAAASPASPLVTTILPAGLVMTIPHRRRMTSPAGADGATGSKSPLTMMTMSPPHRASLERDLLGSLERDLLESLERDLMMTTATARRRKKRNRSPSSTKPTSTTTTLKRVRSLSLALARVARDLTDQARAARDPTDQARAARDPTDQASPERDPTDQVSPERDLTDGAAGEPSAALTPKKRDASSGAAEDGADLPREASPAPASLARDPPASLASHLEAARATVDLASLERDLARVERDLLASQARDHHLRKRPSSTRPMSTTTTKKRALMAHLASQARDLTDRARAARDLTDRARAVRDLTDRARAVRDLTDQARVVREDTVAGGKRSTLDTLLFRHSVLGPPLCLVHC